MKKLVLASASPRRKALLTALGILFDVIVTQTDELSTGEPDALVIANARAKCLAAAAQITGPSIVIGADTLVFLDSEVLSKPTTTSEARLMLQRLSGNTHVVKTGLCLFDTETQRFVEGCESTCVTFRNLTEAEIDRFISAVNPLDRAGAYTVDGPGSLLVKKYEGCFYNVLGLPIVRLDELLRNFGISLFDELNAESAIFL